MSSIPITRVLRLALTASVALAFGVLISAAPLGFVLCPFGPAFICWILYRTTVLNAPASRATTLLAIGLASAVCGIAIARPQQNFQRPMPRRLSAQNLTVRELRDQMEWSRGGPVLSDEVLEQRLLFATTRPSFDDIDRALRSIGARLRYATFAQSVSLWEGIDFFRVDIVPLEGDPPPLHNHEPVLIRWT